MRQKAAAALLALASIQICAGTLLAKPTRTLARPATRKFIVAQPVAPPAARSSHERAARQSDPHAPTRAGSTDRDRIAAAPPSRSSHSGRDLARDREAVRLPPSGRSHAGARTLAEERTLAAQSAIAVADRSPRSQAHADTRAESRSEIRAETHTLRSRRASANIQSATLYSSPRLHDSVMPRPPVDGAATGDEPTEPSSVTSSATNASYDTLTAMTNINGVLRPAFGTQPLKSIEEEASTPVLLPPLRVSSLYDSRGRLVVPAPLYGSREILLHQNQMADRDGLDRIRDDADLLDLRREKKLVPLPEGETLRVDYHLPENRRFSRPWTAAFLTVLAADFYASFHTQLQVDSAVRTVQVQQRLIRTNGNAAPADGDTASPHLTGQAVDIAKSGLTGIQVAWMRTYLQPLIDLGKIDVEEEFRQSCFHISVYKSFQPLAPSHLSVATRQNPPETLP